MLGAAGCGEATNGLIEARSQALETGEVFKIGVLLDGDSPANANFVAAATLANTQLNQGLASAGSSDRFELVLASYSGFGDVQTPAIDLVNNQGVLVIVTDTDHASSQVNQLNHEFVPRIDRKVLITCHQCSSPRFHDFSDPDLGYSDTEGWLAQTYFNAGFEAAVQVRSVLRRPRHGDFNRDGHLKIVVYADSDHHISSFDVAAVLDRLDSGPHSVEVVLKGTGPGESPGPGDLDEVFNDQVPPGVADRAPDAVYLNMLPQNAVAVLQAVRDYPLANKPPISANEAFRRDYHLTSSAAIWEGLEGSSPMKLAANESGTLFRTAFVAATGQQPEFTASFLYDAVVMQAGAIGWAFHFGSLDPFVIQGNIFNVNDPTGRLIRPRPADFKLAAQRIDQELPINYEGASSSMDLDGLKEIGPDLVRWKVVNGQFVDQDVYICNAENPDCRRR